MFDRVKDTILTHITGAPSAIIADQKGSKGYSGKTDEVTGQPVEYAVPSLFDPSKHKKYHAKYYFQKETTRPIEDADRTDNCRKAYNDFLEGLEQINNQEYLKEDYLGQARGGKQSEAFMPGLEELEHKVKDVNEFAHWTRLIRTRSSAHSSQQFAKRLKTRAQIGIQRNPNSCKPEAIPIRSETAALLTRPLEPDFTWVGAITYVVQMAIYLYTLYVQITSIVGVCSNSYMCPFQTKSSGLPVLAPPIAYRGTIANTVRLEDKILYQSKYNPWKPKLAESCILGAPGCDDPGYMIQWPYIEVDSNANEVRFPQELVDAGCKASTDPMNMWQFDPFLSGGGAIRNEYWDCSDAANPESIAFTSRHVGANGTVGTTVFHYKPSFYISNHKATLECMDQTLPNYGDGKLTRADWNAPSLSTTEKGDMRQEVISCLSGKSLTDSMECACNQHEWLEFALGLYHPGSIPTKTCRGGVGDGQLCVDRNAEAEVLFDTGDGDNTVALQCVGGECENHFDGQVPLSRNYKYGCWFTSALSSSSQLNAVYYPCGISYSTASDQYASSETLISLQSSIDMVISKRTALITVFLVKEGCIFTAVAIVPILGLFLLLLLLFLFYVLVLPIRVLCKLIGMDLDFTLNGIVILVKGIIFMQLRILWTMCINFSTLYRVVRMGLALFRGLVNPSLRDLDTKLTTVANTVFSLVLLIALADGSVNTAVVTSLCLSLLQLLYAMNTEKIRLMGIAEPFKDLNENRLTKFEIALMLTKIMEDLLEEDVQYNWVQHFNDPDEPLKPFDFTFPETLGSSNYEYDDVLMNNETFEPKKNLEERFDDILFHLIGEEQNTTIKQTWLAPIPSNLLKFGHDGQAYIRKGQQDKAEVLKNPKSEAGQTVQWTGTGKFYPTHSKHRDEIVRVEIKDGKSDMDLLKIARSRDIGGPAANFFNRPLFDAGHEEPEQSAASGGLAPFPLSSTPSRTQASMFNSRTPVKRGSNIIEEEENMGPSIV